MLQPLFARGECPPVPRGIGRSSLDWPSALQKNDENGNFILAKFETAATYGPATRSNAARPWTQ